MKIHALAHWLHKHHVPLLPLLLSLVFAALCATEAGQITTDLAKLEADPALLAALQRRSFIEKGLELVEGPECPLCDTAWDDEESLRAHLQAKLAKSAEAKQLQDSLKTNGVAISDEVIRISNLIAPVQKLATAEGDTVSPDGRFLVMINKWALDRFHDVGPLLPQNMQLVDLTAAPMQLLYDMPVPIGEPHYAQIIKADKLSPIEIYTPVGYEPILGARAEHAVEATEGWRQAKLAQLRAAA